MIFNTLISLDAEVGVFRNLGFIRIIILFAAFNYFFKDNLFSQRLMFVWFLIISVVVFDVFFENLRKNLLGYPETGENIVSYGSRLVSFFKDEPIVGGFIYSFFLILMGYLFEKYKKVNIFLILLTITFFFSIFVTGERANTLKPFRGISFFTFLKKLI